jgi:hypothetical protein
MPHDYDVSFKLLFRYSKGLIAHALFGDAGVTEWLNVEQPRVNNPRVDLLARCGDGRVRHVEIETTNDPGMARRKAEYYLGFWRLLDEHVEQVLLFASRRPLTMSPVFETPSMRFEFRILDLKTWDGEPLLASEDWGDNVLALLTRVEQERVLQRVEEQIHKLNGEEKQNAANLCTVISGIMGIVKDVAKRINMIDIMENEVIGPAIRQGIEQGKAQATMHALSRLLTQKFGSLPDPIVTRLRRASEAELLIWLDRVLTASTLDEVFA